MLIKFEMVSVTFPVVCPVLANPVVQNHVADRVILFFSAWFVPGDVVHLVAEHIESHYGLKDTFSETHRHTDFFNDSFVALSEVTNDSDECCRVAWLTNPSFDRFSLLNVISVECPVVLVVLLPSLGVIIWSILEGFFVLSILSSSIIVK